MKRFGTAALCLAIALSPMASFAGNGKGNSPDTGKPKVQRVAPSKGTSLGNCPPGLAKKNVPCVPPGQMKSQYRVGDIITGDFSRIKDPYRYGLRRGGYYIRAGDYIYQVDSKTHKVLNLIGAVADILQ